MKHMEQELNHLELMERDRSHLVEAELRHMAAETSRQPVDIGSRPLHQPCLRYQQDPLRWMRDTPVRLINKGEYMFLCCGFD